MTSIAVTVPAILSVTGSPITSSGTFAITTAVTPTGTGAIVLASSPSLTTPTLVFGTNNTTPVITATGGNGPFLIQNSTLAVSGRLDLLFGRDRSSFNLAVIDFNYNALNSNTNTIGFGFFGANNVVTINGVGTVFVSSLTASYSVHTDASKNLVSVQNIGTGLNILQTSPTLITPNLGVASGTSLNLSSLTASYSVHTDASKNLVSVQNIGTGLNILQISPTLITPILGVASGTSLNLSGLTASYSVHTDASKNLVSIQNNGTGLNVMQTLPTLVYGTGSSTPVLTCTGGSGLLLATNSTLTTSNKIDLQFGRDQSNFNVGIINFNYNSLNSNTNTIGLGFFGANNLFTINGAGQAEIVSSTPILTIRTSGNAGGSLYLGNSGHGVVRSSNDVVMYTTSGTLNFKTNGSAGVDNMVVSSTQVTVNQLAVLDSGSKTAFSNFFCNGGGIAAASETKSDYCATFNGWVQFNTGWRIVSDSRIKEKVEDLTESTKFKKLKPKSYFLLDRRRDPKIQYGMIAQEVKDIYPEAIGSNGDYLPDVMENGKVTGKYTFEYYGVKNLEDKLLVYIYPGEIEVRKEVKVVKRSLGVYTLNIEIPSDKIFIYGNYDENLLNINYTAFVPVLIAELQATNKHVETLKEQIETLKSLIN